ncbi:Two-component signal transduction system YycFG, regulatory protein YycH [Halobacillus karajensis]|uniref:Two-component system YycF/YycG regulatory protein YycH n=1 Tax=Halobacillus karajensis TaxID=195088 RepID=A0A059NXL3_9BACI|nr:two-component system activity regulator YycH [Halobacillus karajensis]CDQ18440.1 Two-component system YycF/YycG regulatory protein YycH [Halobacillus karajensis]CDQ23488.1 Two-component system YycF/YycG regulatory protein YycH [Halobacillus karajensis]CDQ26970.1 Two-component system YycF/YycG regulatory protein YycH [Halobacillus karajensis]SEH51366.1 Two-component signal transduction system YycFG, regulatory protein YycH [Halobacillus karajensis]
MKKETMKSVILVILIAFSLVLTVALWTYQPVNETLEEDVFIDDTKLEETGAEREVANLVLPDRIIFHEQGSFYSFRDNVDKKAFYDQMQNWNLTTLDVNPGRIDLDNHSRVVEIHFPAKLSIHVIKDLFQLNDEGQLEEVQANFDRVFLLHHPEGSAPTSYDLWFVDSDASGSDATLQATISSTAGEDALQVLENKDKLTEMIRFADVRPGEQEDETGASNIYVPSGPVEISEYVLQTGTVPGKPIQNDLFPPNTRVSRSTNNNGDNILKTFRRRLTQNEKRMEYEWMVPNSANQNNWSEYELFVKSMEDINSHLGWTDDYRLNSVQSGRDEVQYRMYFNERPVMENSDSYMLATILLSYQQGQIQEYKRPLVHFSSINESKAILQSGEEVLQDIKEKEDINYTDIRDIKVMYSLEEQRNDVVYSLIPEWYVLTNSGWSKVYPDDRSQNAEIS